MMSETGSDKIKKAVIPIAGNGTRMFPETFFIKKVMLPIVSSDGIVKPALLYMLEELAECGIEDIFLIVGKGETGDYERLFKFEEDLSYEAKLPEKVRSYYKEIYDLGRRLRFVEQTEKKGFGHAVYQARQFLEGEPSVLLLGDFLYKSNSSISCTQQTMDAFSLSGGKTVVGIRTIDVSECTNYGILHGRFRGENERLLDADTMVEKPDVDYAKKNLLVDGRCYATFGSYVLTDDVFEYVGRQIRTKSESGDTSETDLTGAFMDAAGKGRLTGALIDGRSFDVGLPEMYYNTFTEFGKK